MKTVILNRTGFMTAGVFAAGISLLVPDWWVPETIFESEPNDSLATAQDVDGHFSLDFRLDIGDAGFVANTSTTLPPVTLGGGGEGTFDYYSYYAPGAGSSSGQVIFDVDYSSRVYSHLALWDAGGTLLFHNDDYDHQGGAGGSISDTDSLIAAYLTSCCGNRKDIPASVL